MWRVRRGRDRLLSGFAYFVGSGMLLMGRARVRDASSVTLGLIVLQCVVHVMVAILRGVRVRSLRLVPGIEILLAVACLHLWMSSPISWEQCRSCVRFVEPGRGPMKSSIVVAVVPLC